MKGVVIGVFLFFFCVSSYAYYSVDLTTDDSLSRDLRLTEFSRADFISFSESESGESLIRITYKNGNVSHNGRNQLIYRAVVSSTIEEPRLVFFTEENCLEGSSHNSVIRINEQNVGAGSMCEKNSEGDLINIFYILSEAGRDYAVSQFENNKMIRIRFKERVIPFDATGFSEAWDEAGEPVL